MLNKTIWFGLILSIASAALAQEEVGPDSATETVEAVSAQATQTCQVTYSSGIDNTAMRFCVTVNGNISQFSVRRNRLFAEEGDPGIWRVMESVIRLGASATTTTRPTITACGMPRSCSTKAIRSR